MKLWVDEEAQVPEELRPPEAQTSFRMPVSRQAVQAMWTGGRSTLSRIFKTKRNIPQVSSRRRFERMRTKEIRTSTIIFVMGQNPLANLLPRRKFGRQLTLWTI